MALLYTEDQLSLIEMVRDMANRDVAPHVVECDRSGDTPRELFDPCFEMGLHMLEVPEEFGGAGMDYETTAMIFEELAKVDAGYADTIVTTFVALRNVIMAGTPEQGQLFADVVANNGFGCFAVTEPGAGSDAGAIRCSAVPDGNGNYIINGTKCFATNGAYADIVVGFFRIPDVGITAFMFETKDLKGYSVGAHEDKMGFRMSNTTDLIFEDVVLPESCIVGVPGQGLKIALNGLNVSRAFLSTMGVGIMQRALDEAVKYAKIREQFGKPIIEQQLVQGLLADMAIKVEASRCLVNNTMKMIDAGLDCRKEASITKTFVTESMEQVTSNAIQVFGGYGYSREYPVEKLYRDARIFQIFEGSNQIQRTTIAKALKKEYK